MDRGLYIAATGMLTQRKRMDVVTNNIANVDTTGYKKDYSVSRTFADVLVSSTNGSDPYVLQQYREVGPLNWGIHIDRMATDFTQGPLEQTDRTADFALSGDGFFVVETPDGMRYTRSGDFQVDANGYLCTSEGYYVQGTGGRIRVGGQNFTVDQQGNITSPAGASRLQIVRFADNGTLRKAGNNLYSGTAAATPLDAEVRQGFLESSNVDVGQEMVDMLEVSRNYESNQKVVTTFNDLLSKSVNDVGRV